MELPWPTNRGMKYTARQIFRGLPIRRPDLSVPCSNPKTPVFASNVKQAAIDLDALFAEYDIQDKATLISMLTAKLSLQELNGDAAGGLETISKLRELQSKPDLKLTVALFDEALLKAQQTGKKGADYEQKVESIYRNAVNALPWEVIQDVIKSARSNSGLLSEAFLLGRVQEELQPDQKGIRPPMSLSKEVLGLFIWKQAIIDAMNSAPDTLFVTRRKSPDVPGFVEDVLHRHWDFLT